MSTALASDLRADDDLGQLANNGIVVASLQTTLSKGESNVRLIPKLILRIDKDDAWQAFVLGQSPEKVHRWNAAEFRRFIESPRPAGCQTPLHVLERMARDTEAWETYLRLTRADRGNPNYDEQPRTDDGTFMGRNRDNITVTADPPTIPLSQGIPRPRVRDFDREAPTGTSVSYTLRMLERGLKRRTGEFIPPRPDLLEQVKSGGLSPNAAAILAGYRLPSITVPAEPKAASRVLLQHFQGDDLDTLIHELTNWAGIPLSDKAELDSR